MALFEESPKEPKLSSHILNRLYNGQDKVDGVDGYDDIHRYKSFIKNRLLTNPDVLNALHNLDLLKKDPQCTNGEAYYHVNVFDFLKIPDTQSVVKNFICYEVHDIEEAYGAKNFVKKRIAIRTVSHADDVITDYDIPRQDLLGLIVKDLFNWYEDPAIGSFKKIYDQGKVTEDGYYYRDIYYEVTVTNSIGDKQRNQYD